VLDPESVVSGFFGVRSVGKILTTAYVIAAEMPRTERM